MKEKPIEELPEALLWAEGGHASDVVLTAVADGEHRIVPASALAHVERCPVCMGHLGNAALLSLETRRLLVPARRRVPRAAVALGLLTAVLGLLPRLVERPSAAGAVSSVTRELATVVARLDTLPVAATYVAALSLVLTGLLFARLSPKKEVSS